MEITQGADMKRGCWKDVGLTSPSEPGYYEIEDVHNDFHRSYWDGKAWYIHWENIKEWPQKWLEIYESQ